MYQQRLYDIHERARDKQEKREQILAEREERDKMIKEVNSLRAENAQERTAKLQRMRKRQQEELALKLAIQRIKV